MRLEWSTPASNDVRDAATYVAAGDLDVATRLANRILDAVEILRDHPNIGRIGRAAGSRELVIRGTPFIAVYRIQGDTNTILRVLHHARRWPPRG